MQHEKHLITQHKPEENEWKKTPDKKVYTEEWGILGKWNLIIYHPNLSRWNDFCLLTIKAMVMPVNFKHCLLLSWPHVPASLGRLCVIQRLSGLLSTESDWRHTEATYFRAETPVQNAFEEARRAIFQPFSNSHDALLCTEWKRNYCFAVQIM